MNRKDFFNDYLRFTHKERIALIALILVIVILMILPHFFPGVSAARMVKADTSWMAAANAVIHRLPDSVRSYSPRWSAYSDSAQYRPHYSYARNNYYHPGKNNYYRSAVDTFKDHPRYRYERRERKVIPVEINTADSAAWEALPGIGPVLAARIIKFRDKLGGFYSIEQVKEVYGIPDSTFQLIKPSLKLNSAQLRKINVNTASKEELKIHPYIRWQLAGMIADYRTQHGKFETLDDLKKLQLITDDVFVKIAPYVSL